MKEPFAIRTSESFLLVPDENFYRNMSAAARHGTIFIINTGYASYLTQEIHAFRECVVFNDIRANDRRVVSYKVILNVTVGLSDKAPVYEAGYDPNYHTTKEFTPHEKRS